MALAEALEAPSRALAFARRRAGVPSRAGHRSSWPRIRSRPLASAEDTPGAARLTEAAAGVLALAVMTDSAMEHFRGSYNNPAMYLAPTVSTLALAAACRGGEAGRWRKAIFAGAVVAGVAGTAFHLYNIGKREGRFDMLNLFYGAPIGAPAALSMAGLYGLAAAELAEADAPLKRRLGFHIAWSAVVGLVGTVAEVALFHFRGAFQNPFMFVPVTIPPAAAGALGAALVWPVARLRKAAEILLGATAVVGTVGMGFHAFGIHRAMGGWDNWRQNVIDGPPMPAPLGFVGMALAGLAGLKLTGRGR